MAYLNYLASAPRSEVEAIRDDLKDVLSASLVVSVSHLIAYWVQVQPLGQLLGQAIDGGRVLNSALHHKLRDPCYHDSETVRLHYAKLSEAWEQAASSQPVAPDDWYRIEIEKVLRLFAYALEHNECVVSILEPHHGISLKLNK